MTRGFVSGIRVDFTEPVVATRYQVLRSFGTPRTLLMALDDWGGPVPEQFKHRNEHFTGTVILDIAQGSSDDELRIVGIIIRRHRPKPKAP